MEIETAISIALTAHAGQTDRAGAPYILHPLRLMLAAATPDERVVAVLHDVVEDSDFTMDELRQRGLTDAQAEALAAVTKREGESYPDFIARAAANPLARAVKILDLRDNSDRSRLSQITEKDEARFAKYAAALRQLGAD